MEDMRLAIKKVNQAVITLGGRGTRLKEITNDIPKPLWPVLGTSCLERCVKNLITFGIDNFIFLVGYKENLFEKEARTLFNKYGIKIAINKENFPRGEAGALIDVITSLENKFLFINGDIIFNLDFNKLFEFDFINNSDLTFTTHTTTHPFDSDCIIENPSLGIFDHKFKDNKNGNPSFFLGNAGISLVSKKVVEFVSNSIDKKKELSFFKDFIIFANKNKFNVFSYNTSEYMFDMGTPKRLIKVEKDLKNKLVFKKSYVNPQKALFLDRDNTLIKCKKGSYICAREQIDIFKERVIKLANIGEQFDLIIMVSNQPQISMGLTDWQGVININGELINNCLKLGLKISCFYICPHHPHRGFNNEILNLKSNCFCRKPNPGMFLEASFNRNINLSKSLMIGDSIADKKAALNASLDFKWIDSI